MYYRLYIYKNLTTDISNGTIKAVRKLRNQTIITNIVTYVLQFGAAYLKYRIIVKIKHIAASSKNKYILFIFEYIFKLINFKFIYCLIDVFK
jgi:hypothetical protein